MGEFQRAANTAQAGRNELREMQEMQRLYGCDLPSMRAVDSAAFVKLFTARFSFRDFAYRGGGYSVVSQPSGSSYFGNTLPTCYG